MSRNVSILIVRWFVLVAAVLVLSPTTSFGLTYFTGGSVSGDDYEDAVLGAGNTEGDIWGGEQGSDPWINPDGPSPSEQLPLINTNPDPRPFPVPSPKPKTNAGQASWLAQLGFMFDWLQASLRFANPN